VGKNPEDEMKLRAYQQRCHDAIIESWQSNRSTLAVLATGTGKTVIFAHVIKSMQPKRALVLAHREELIWQARDKISQATGLRCEVEMANWVASTNLFHRMPVVVSTVQTQMKRMSRFKPSEFGIVIVDEAHHSTASSYRKILDYYMTNDSLKVLGVTATPDRADQAALGQVFQNVAFRYDILDGIEDGWLVDITQQFCSVSTLDFSHVRTTAGDLNGADLAMVMEAEENIQGICHPTLEVLHGLEPHTLDKIPVPQWSEYLKGLNRVPRRSIVFTASVSQAEACCNILNRAVPKMAEWVCGKTNKEERRKILGRFSTGETQVVVNCGVLTEGFDNPAVEVIFMARPTKSRSLYCQMVGRSTRPLPGLVDPFEMQGARKQAINTSAKPFCRIIDFAGNSGKHKLMTAIDVLGGHLSEDIINRTLKRVKGDGKPVRVCRALTIEEVKKKEEVRQALERARRNEEARKAALIAKSRFTQRAVNPFDTHDRVRTPVPVERGGRLLSEKQKSVLRKAGYDPARFTYRQAQAVIGKIIDKWFPNRQKRV
jgi:superfamily II DNA or RNA helicase